VLAFGRGKNDQKEIGFYECRASVPLASLLPADPSKAENNRDGCSAFFPEQFISFHWHGDTFGIPDGAAHLVSSAPCNRLMFDLLKRLF
jgi:GMP synthase-like glutamine amidotransferase